MLSHDRRAATYKKLYTTNARYVRLTGILRASEASYAIISLFRCCRHCIFDDGVVTDGDHNDVDDVVMEDNDMDKSEQDIVVCVHASECVKWMMPYPHGSPHQFFGTRDRAQHRAKLGPIIKSEWM